MVIRRVVLSLLVPFDSNTEYRKVYWENAVQV